MAEAVSAVLGFGVGVAISPVPIIAVILMLFSQRARANGLLFLLGWSCALAVVAGAAYALAAAGRAASEETAEDAVAWGTLVLGALLLLLAARTWRARPAPGAVPDPPAWMAGIDALRPGRALGMGLLLAGANPKNLMLGLAAGSALAGLGLSSGEAVAGVVVFVVIGSLTIAGPVVYALVGGERARLRLDDLKGWLAVHNSAVMTVLFLVFGASLVGESLPPLL